MLSSSRAEAPNIVVILADDMGYSDIGCFGSEIRTPNLDRLAREGVRFTQFANTARCCPSRASLLTGLYPHQAGVGQMEEDLGDPAYQGHLKRGCITLPEVLREAGYRTIMSGKWHLGTEPGDRPWERGFERFYGIPQGGGVYFWPTRLARDVVMYDAADARGPVVTTPDEHFYSTDDFTTYAVAQIRAASRDRTPFFLYVPYVAPHFPQQAWEEDVQRYLGRYRDGWEKRRQQRYRRQLEMGIIERRFPLSPVDAIAWESLDEKQKRALDRQMAVYAAQVARLDWNVGRLLGALREGSLDDNTLVVFLSDNGAQRNADFGEEDHPESLFGSRESYGKYAKGWANLSNTPFRRFKSEEHNGGNLTPFIARWPGRIPGGGGIRRQPAHIIDLVPTCLEAAGLNAEAMKRGSSAQALEGTSLMAYCAEGQRIVPERCFGSTWAIARCGLGTGSSRPCIAGRGSCTT